MHYFLWIILFLVSYIIPKDSNLYIFWSINWKTFSGNSKAMFLYVLNNKTNKKIFYHIRNKKLIKKLENDFPFLKNKLIFIKGIKWFWNVLRAKYIFTDSDMYDVSSWLSYQMWNFNVINQWHGEWFKKLWFMGSTKYTKIPIFLKKYIKNYFQNVVKLWTVSSKFMQKHFNLWHKTNKYKITWLARNDVFFRDDLEIFNIRKRLSLSKYKKNILYVPTWRQDSYDIKPFSDNFLQKLNNFCEEKNYLFIIKAHQNSNPILHKKYSNIIDISKDNLDSQELMKYSDFMITDYSSIFIDYLLLDKPIFFYAYDYKNYSKNLVNLIDKYENCVIKEWICYSESSLLKLLEKWEIIFDNKNYNKNFKKLKDKYHKYQKWWYCENILKFIEN